MIIELSEFCTYFRYKSLVRYKTCRYSLSFYLLSFYFPHGEKQMSLLFALCLPFWWNRLRALPGALIHPSSPYVSLPPPGKLRARKHSHCLLLLKTGIFPFLEAQLPFLKTRSPFKVTINYLYLVQNLKLSPRKGGLCLSPLEASLQYRRSHQATMLLASS